MCLPMMLLVLLAGPVLLVGTAAAALGSHGAVGVLGAIALVLGAGAGTLLAGRCGWRWWRSSKAPELTTTSPRR